MNASVGLGDRLDENAILAKQAALMHDSDPASAEHWRTEQVWFGGGHFGPRGAAYIAPYTHAPGVIDDLLAFTRRADVPSLARIAITQSPRRCS